MKNTHVALNCHRPCHSRPEGGNPYILNRIISLAIILCVFLLASCGGDSGSSADPDEPVSSSAVKKSSSSKGGSGKSSSSKAKSSSSTKKSSSSAKSSSATSNNGKAIYDAKNNTMKDPRDNKTYKTVKIGDQVWMAENLNYKSGLSYCFGEEPSSKQNSHPGLCNTYGRLYKWDAATEVCPDGWHLPSKTEFETLLKTVGGADSAGIKLKSVDGWKFEKKETVGTDDYGFTALPGGYRKEDNLSGLVVTGNIESYDFIGDKVLAYFWTSTEDIETSTRLSDGGILLDHAFSLLMKNVWADAILSGEYMDNAMSVRCVLGSTSSSSDAKSSSSKKTESSSSAKSSSSVKASSSSTQKSSSSTAKSESSVAVAKACKTSTEDNCEYGELVDDRDGQTYKTVKIGNQWWMAQNLNYRREAKYKNDYCYCYNNSKDNCDKFGRLYVWTAAADACPKGWHLPSTAEWKTLIDAVGGEEVAGITLKTSGWNHGGDATDAFGFSVLPAGYRDWLYQDDYYEEGYQALFWSSNEYENSSGCVYFQSVYDGADIRSGNKDDGYSVRCVMGVEPEIIEPPVIIVPEAKACKTETKDECEYGLLTDSRDKKTYKTVKIGNQWWMAENLNLETPNSYCYNDSAKYCTQYGRLYTWASAMDSVGNWSSNGKGCGYGGICSPTYPVRGVCPERWHLPTKAELDMLVTAVGGQPTAGKMLKSTSGWITKWGTVGNGPDVYAFSALPAGIRASDGACSDEGELAYFWSSTENKSNNAYSMLLSYNFEDAFRYSYKKNLGLSVRCVQDDK